MDTSNNPYKSSISDIGPSEVPFNPKGLLFLIGVHVVAMAIIGLMLASCLVTFVPTMSASEVQNALLRRMCFIGLIGFGVHIYGIALLFNLWKRLKKDTKS